MAKKVYSFRLEEEIVSDARKHDVDIRDLLEKTLEKMVKKKVCATCNQIVSRKLDR